MIKWAEATVWKWYRLPLRSARMTWVSRGHPTCKRLRNHVFSWHYGPGVLLLTWISLVCALGWCAPGDYSPGWRILQKRTLERSLIAVAPPSHNAVLAQHCDLILNLSEASSHPSFRLLRVNGRVCLQAGSRRWRSQTRISGVLHFCTGRCAPRRTPWMRWVKDGRASPRHPSANRPEWSVPEIRYWDSNLSEPAYKQHPPADTPAVQRGAPACLVADNNPSLDVVAGADCWVLVIVSYCSWRDSAVKYHQNSAATPNYYIKCWIIIRRASETSSAKRAMAARSASALDIGSNLNALRA